MKRTMLIAALSCSAGLLATDLAKADCEGDLIQLEDAYKAPGLKPEARVALDKAKNTAVSALRKDDDETCHKAVADALPKAGLTLK